MLAAFTCVAADRGALEQMFRDLGAEAHRLCDGMSEGPPENPEAPPPTTGILGDDSTKGTPVAISVGASLFDDRYGLADKRPRELVEMPYLVNDRLDGQGAMATCSCRSRRIGRTRSPTPSVSSCGPRGRR